VTSLPLRFDGPVYDPDLDRARLTKQHEQIRDLMLDGKWRTLGEIAELTGQPEASISAQLRHLKKARFGGYEVPKQRRGNERRGLWEYRVLAPANAPKPKGPPERERFETQLKLLLAYCERLQARIDALERSGRGVA